MLLNVGTEKMGNERKSNADISFLFLYKQLFQWKMPPHVFLTSSVCDIKTRGNDVKNRCQKCCTGL